MTLPPFIGKIAILVKLEGAERVNAFADAVEGGSIGLSSPTGALQARLGLPQVRLRPYRDVLTAAPSVEELVLALRAAAEAVAVIASTQPTIEIAWTYPGNTRPGIRTTGGVARDVVTESRRSLLLVGYSVTVDPALTGLAAQTIEAIARAAERGVIVTAVLHRDVNRQALLQAWRPGIRPPSIFRWPDSDHDQMAAVHAKLLIADRNDGLAAGRPAHPHQDDEGSEAPAARRGGRPDSSSHRGGRDPASVR